MTATSGPESRLRRYREMREFSRTPEPTGDRAAPAPTGDLRFVVQRHRASRLHYDLRFEMGGVLASWAVPKGPTLDADVRRMAVHVEDHPVEYLHFEGVIPGGQYGAGDVIVWDTGTYTCADGADPLEAVLSGELHVDLFGSKLRGRFALVRRTRGDDDRSWMLVHKHDESAVPGWDPEAHARSVLSGRTNDEVRADPRSLWHSGLPADRAEQQLLSDVALPSDDELAALDALGSTGTWQVFGRSLRVTNLDKELFPAGRDGAAVTKRDLLRYSAQIAPTLLPYVENRAMNLRRHPEGATAKGFWHKQLPEHAPDWVGRWDNPEADPGETTTYLVVNEPATVVWMANFGALEWHAWTSLTDAPHLPTYALIDLDPGERTTWEALLVLARLHRDALDHLGVRGYPKLSGRRGIQVWIPVGRGPSFDETRDWVHALSRAVSGVVPELVSRKWGVSERGGLARLDYTQNAINKTLVCPYSPRAAAGAPVSTPISWDELDDPQLRPDRVTIRDLLERLRLKGDVFRGALVTDQHLPALQ